MIQIKIFDWKWHVTQTTKGARKMPNIPQITEGERYRRGRVDQKQGRTILTGKETGYFRP
jgi:hypothetical protein